MFSSSRSKYSPVSRYDAETGGRSPSVARPAWRRYAVLLGVGLGLVLFLTHQGRGDSSARSEVAKDSSIGYDHGKQSGIKTFPIADSEDYDDVTPPKHSSNDPTEATEDDDRIYNPSRPKKPPLTEESKENSKGKGPKLPTNKQPPKISTPPPASNAVAPISMEVPLPKGPDSFEHDDDPTRTTYCVKPFDPTKKLVQYALVIDAGSTGSRIHAYKFNYCNAAPMLEYETFKMTRPGLSSFKDSPSKAAGSLNELLDEALRVVPETLRKCTPIAVKATAGLRLLGEKESNAILKEVEHHIRNDYPFPLIEKEPVVVMDGKDEGVYAWITANYLLGLIGEDAPVTASTLAVMDLGGASTQIVFAPTFPNPEKDTLVEGDHKYALTFGGREFTLYQHSYLGYGLMRARRSVHNLVAFWWAFTQADDVWDKLTPETTKILSPCLAPSKSKIITLDPHGRKPVNVTMEGSPSGGYEACKRVIELVMAKDDICEVKPCSFNGVYQPSLLDTFPTGSFLALSYFTDRIAPLLKEEEQQGPFTLKTLKSLAQTVCAGPNVWQNTFKSNPGALKELEERDEYCLDLTFMHALLGLGYEITDDRDLLVGKQLRAVELGWALGAGLAMLEGDLQCLV